MEVRKGDFMELATKNAINECIDEMVEDMCCFVRSISTVESLLYDLVDRIACDADSLHGFTYSINSQLEELERNIQDIRSRMYCIETLQCLLKDGEKLKE